MSDLAMDDERVRAALARLTDNEKECLRRKLRQQTAKEMALELGVSPHAVEKRLKMARAKLGLSSSLDAARLLAASEQYQQPVPHPADLHSAGATGDEAGAQADPRSETAWTGWRRRSSLVSGGVLMILLATALALALQPSGHPSVSPSSADPVPAPGTSGPQTGLDGKPIVWETHDPEAMVEPTPTEMHMTITTTFGVLDIDRSGFIEADETLPTETGGVVERPIYRRDEAGTPQPTGEVHRVSVAQARAEYIAMMDKNADGKLDFAEYRDWSKNTIARTGIPAAWREDIARNYGPASAR